MVSEFINSRTYIRECYCYLVSINGVPCSCFSSETEAKECCEIICADLSNVNVDNIDVFYKHIKFFSHW